VVIAMALGATYLASTGAGAQEEEAPEATEVGITEDEIRIAVIADVENAAAPGLFKGSVDAVKGWAKFINKNGGLAGRDVKIDFFDSQLSPDEARNAVIQACEDSFALVGTSALFLSNVTDLAGCPDMAGDPTGLPDIAVVATEVDQQCNPTTYGVNPPQILCDTRSESPQTYQANAGRYYYYEKELGDDLHGAYIYTSDLKSANNANRATMGGMIDLGIEADTEVDISARAPQAQYTPIVQTLKDEGSNYAQSGSAFNSTVALRKEAALQGVNDPDFIWDCTLQCYDQRLIEQGGADVEDQYVSLLFLPFEEADTTKSLRQFLKFTGRDKADGFGIQAWAGAMLLKEAVDNVVAESGVNGVTRAAVLEQLGQINDFDAGGMLATTNIGERTTSPCYVLMQVQDGEFVRIFPKKEGTFDCKERNVVNLELNLL